MSIFPAPLVRQSLLLFFALLLVGPAAAQKKATQIDRLVAAYHDYGIFNGTVLVAEKGKVLFKKGYGMANMEWDMPNEADTRFRLGSITKQFTAALILQLEAEGKLSTADYISKHLPDYPGAVADKVTIHHLLVHTSGIPSYTGLPEFFNEKSRDPYTPDEFIEVFSTLPLEFEPGSTWRYNNSGYFLLGVIAEKVTGMSYADALQAYIFEPLGMAHSGYDTHAAILKKRATGYERGAAGYITAPYLDMSLPYAAGSLYSTVEDLFLWDRALSKDKLLSVDLKEKMFTPYMNDYGYGWFIDDDRAFGDGSKESVIIGHGGGINGFNTILERAPEEGHLVVLLNNTGGTVLGSISKGIFDILYGFDAELPKKPIVMEMSKLIESKGIEAAVNRYNRLYAEQQDAYDFSEQGMNGLGYALLQQDKVDAAVAMFTLNTETYPDAFNTWDSLGEAYMERGDHEKAIAHYEKSLTLNPRNENAKEKLAEMGVEVDESLGQEIEVAPEILASYVGTYEINPGFELTITLEGAQLYAQATGQPRLEIFAQSEVRFFLKVVQAELEFRVAEDGIADQVTLYQGGREAPAKRVK
ncbi:MAG: serine hydrolase [Bacteroidota bacterium]